MQLRIDLDELRISSKANATIETGCPLPICKNLTIDSEGTREFVTTAYFMISSVEE